MTGSRGWPLAEASRKPGHWPYNHKEKNCANSLCDCGSEHFPNRASDGHAAGPNLQAALRP